MDGTTSAGKKSAKADIMFIGAILLLAAVIFAVLKLTSDGGAYVAVTVDGTEVARCSLSDDGTYVLNGGTNTLVIADGSASITEADCPDGLCMNQGSIQYSGQTIVCLPNKLIVTVYGAQDAPVDIVS